MLTICLIAWHPLLPPLLCGLLIAAAAGWVYLLHKRITTRLTPRRAMLLILPKALILLLLLLAIMNPFWTAVRRQRQDSSVLMLEDISSSMDVTDAQRSRADRALDIVRRFRQRLPASIKLRTIAFDTELHDDDKRVTDNDGALRGTDIGGCLVALKENTDLSSYAAAVMVTDGGDETLESLPALGMPLHVVGVGTDASDWLDVSLAGVEHPESVERETDFEIRVNLLARVGGDERFAQRLKRLDLLLERRDGGQWVKVDEKGVSLSNRRARATFRTSCSDGGLQHYRASVTSVEGEVSILNNSRTFGIDVRRKSVHVLYFTRNIGSELKMIRSELASDPGVTFTALFRTVGERFTVQGEQLPGAEGLGAGLPDDPNLLALFDCLVIGSFAALEWTEDQMKAVVAYVEQGGAVVFLGGDESFAAGGYADTPLAALVPWRMAPGPAEMMRGRFPVSIPLASSEHAIVSGLSERLAGDGEAYVESVNVAGALKSGATSLMLAGLGGRSAPLAVVQRYGDGWTLALASNTLWRWALKAGSISTVHGVFWRQAVRNLCGETEGGQVLSVKWDRKSYRPGERASVDVRVAGDRSGADLRLTADLAASGNVDVLPVEPVQGRQGIFRVMPLFRSRGIHEFTVTARRGEQILETYRKTLNVAPVLPEGSALEVDSEFLTELAESHAGLYVPETEADRLIEHLKQNSLVKTVVSSKSLVHGGPQFLILFLVILMAEWILRRRLNLF